MRVFVVFLALISAPVFAQERQEARPLLKQGEEFSTDFRNSEIVETLRFIAGECGYSVVIDPEVRGEINTGGKFTCETFFQAVLAAHGLGVQITDGVMRIAPLGKLPKSVPAEPELEEPYAVQGPFSSLQAALDAIGNQPITVGEVHPLDPYRQNSGRYSRYGAYPTLRADRVIFSSGSFPVWSDIDPSNTLGGALQAKLMTRLPQRQANSIAPATGPAAVHLASIDAEAGIGRNAASMGNHTYETARYLLAASFSIAEEQVDTKGFDGQVAGQVAAGIASVITDDWRTFSRIRDIADLGRGVQVVDQNRTVQGVLYVFLFDIETRQLLYSAEGVGELESDELSYFNIAGFERGSFEYPNADNLAEAMVRAALGE